MYFFFIIIILLCEIYVFTGHFNKQLLVHALEKKHKQHKHRYM